MTNTPDALVVIVTCKGERSHPTEKSGRQGKSQRKKSGHPYLISYPTRPRAILPLVYRSHSKTT